ncbi:MAG TPA: WYL domain-containing protein [Candidatus Scatavimonas merdigallinarum]|uniref:WYL domain-containing protein n=1 Tax=Candidatus Scatavimonas merdigallinarum TaxID=2840914 RepID=A0A9D0ZJP4_9FIRM|nr:WYL domain-containing protein [Candidatus Scatavimonas merdigallinarum]
MPKSPNQKLKLLYLLKILQERTDDVHAITLAQILQELQAYGITAERKSIYDDLEALRVYGIDVEMRKGKGYAYYIANRTFELPELKLLVDAVQASKFITHKKSNELIKKIEGLASAYQAGQLQRQVVVANRVKTMNESIYYNVDKLHTAISQGKQAAFYYFEWAVSFTTRDKLKKRYRRNGEKYVVSPWALTWDDENYYLVGYDSAAKKMKHYRVDKMQSIEITQDDRDGRYVFDKFNIAEYVKKTFGMFGGEEEQVKLRFKNDKIGVVVDRFGKDISLTQDGHDAFVIQVKVITSPQFFAWLFALGEDVQILSPQNVVKQFKKQMKKTMKQYK